MATYRYATGSRRYIDSRGRPVPASFVRDEVERVSTAAESRVDALTAKLRAGMEPRLWEQEMRAVLKRAHVATGIVGAGGKRNASSSDYGDVGRELRREYGHLADLRAEVETGLDVEGEQFGMRARMYARASTRTYEVTRRNGDKRAGYTEERRVLDAAANCDDCIRYADQGWQPIGKLPMIGMYCECKSNCRCTFQRRLRRKKK